MYLKVVAVRKVSALFVCLFFISFSNPTIQKGSCKKKKKKKKPKTASFSYCGNKQFTQARFLVFTFFRFIRMYFAFLVYGKIFL